MFTRPSALLTVSMAVLVAAVTLVLVASNTTGAAPEPDSPAAPLFTMEFQNVPSDTMAYPTQGWWNKVYVPGMLVVQNYRPEEVFVYLNATIDNTWYVEVRPLMLRFDTTRLDMKSFQVILHIPPNTYGPEDSALVIQAEARSAARTLASAVIEVQVHILTNVDEVLDGMSSIILVLDQDRVFSDMVQLYNVMDVPMEYHISATGVWEDRLSDLDFHSHTLLNPQERRDVQIYGHVSGDVEPGVYQVDLALWTPDPSGNRTIILNRTVDMEFYTLEEDMIFTLLRAGVPIVIAIVTVCVVSLYIVLRRRRRGLGPVAWPSR
jgi:hypothetical protein